MYFPLGAFDNARKCMKICGVHRGACEMCYFPFVVAGSEGKRWTRTFCEAIGGRGRGWNRVKVQWGRLKEGKVTKEIEGRSGDEIGKDEIEVAREDMNIG